MDIICLMWKAIINCSGCHNSITISGTEVTKQDLIGQHTLLYYTNRIGTLSIINLWFVLNTSKPVSISNSHAVSYTHPLTRPHSHTHPPTLTHTHTFALVALISQSPHEVSAMVAPRHSHVVMNLQIT